MGQSNFYDPNKQSSSIAGISGSTDSLKAGEGLVREAKRQILTSSGCFQTASPSHPDSGFAMRAHEMLMGSFYNQTPEQPEPEPA